MAIYTCILIIYIFMQDEAIYEDMDVHTSAHAHAVGGWLLFYNGVVHAWDAD
jgi:succinate dehydrogenase hydrophobic anchor subunit